MGQLGRGATAYVYKVRPRDNSIQQNLSTYFKKDHSLIQLALKVIDKQEVHKKNLIKRIQNEIEVHLHLNHTLLASK